MIPITRKEAFMLREVGRGVDVHISSKSKKSRAKRYWATESFKTMGVLNKYREDRLNLKG